MLIASRPFRMSRRDGLPEAPGAEAANCERTDAWPAADDTRSVPQGDRALAIVAISVARIIAFASLEIDGQ
jgi:hypothetical protein